MELGFGIMRFGNYTNRINYDEVRESIDEYMKNQYCYFDSHPAYVQNESQSIIRQYVVEKYPRDRFFVADKMPYYGISSYEDYEQIFLSELNECGLQYFDYYMLHAVNADVNDIHNKFGGYEFLKKKKSEGYIKNIGISFHDSPELLEQILTLHTELDFVQLQVNWLDWEDPIIRSRENYEIAVKYNKRIIVMEPLKGGTLLRDGESTEKIVRMSFSFLNNLNNIDVVLSGMTNVNQVIENRKIIDILSSEEKETNESRIIDELRNKYNKLNKINCTYCKYCVRECPMNIPIPDILHLLNSYVSLVGENNTFLGSSRVTYKAVTHRKGKAGECISCGKCEKRCPQKLEIRKYMSETKQVFELNNYYSAERNVQILIYLLKAHGIKKIVISPGATNICFVQSVQSDSYFEIFSSADERSAAYLATGIARESGEPVVISCTGATASRNYIPALTEAYYSKLPIIAVTSSQPVGRIGHLVPQMVDRTRIQNDVSYITVELPLVKDGDEESEWTCSVNANKAILTSLDDRKGPAHINLITSYNPDFSVKNLIPAKIINKHRNINDSNFNLNGRIGIFCGAHVVWSERLIYAVDGFCEKYNAIVISDHTGNYNGRFGITNGIIFTQENQDALNEFDLIIHMGNISGAYYYLKTAQVWRISPDGEIVDTFRKLTDVFEMSEEDFFEAFLNCNCVINNNGKRLIDVWKEKENDIRSRIPEIPFSNIWIAQQTIGKLPRNSEIHFGILNSLRAWNLFDLPNGINGYANTGGFGIDGCVSTLVGASLVNKDKLYFGVIGDLAFFYDMNVLGNRHIGNNLRLMIVNNGCGTEFINYNHAASVLSDSEKDIIAARGHYGNKSNELLKNYSQELGFKYMSAHNREEYLALMDEFIDGHILEKSIVFEIFTDAEEESEALRLINTIDGCRNVKKVRRGCTIPERFKDKTDDMTVVLWGTGYCFNKNIAKIKQHITPGFVCDNDEKKWGTEIEGVTCISPKSIINIENPFVVIMVQDATTSLQIVNQLIEMGITSFDIYDNWKDYAQDAGFYK